MQSLHGQALMELDVVGMEEGRVEFTAVPVRPEHARREVMRNMVHGD